MKWSIPTRLIEEGRQLVDEQAIKRVIPDTNRQTWYAEVFDEQWFYVGLDGTAREEDRCQCDMWQQKGYCKHTVSVELFLKEHKVSRHLSEKTKDPFYYPEILGQQTIDVHALYRNYAERYGVVTFENTLPEQIKPLKIKINVSDESSNHALLSDTKLLNAHLWIKSDRWYEVSDWQLFMDTFIHEKNYSLTQQGDKTVWLVKEAFSQSAYALISALASLSGDQTYTSGKEQLLNASMLDCLLQSTKADEPYINWYLNDQDVTLTVHDCDDRPLIFAIQSLDAEQWQIQMADQVHFYRYYHAIVVNDEWYPITADDSYFDAIHNLNELFYLHQNRLEMPEMAFFQFISYFGFVMMQHTLIKNIVSVPLVEPIEPLTVRVSVDIIDKTLHVNLHYDYGDVTVNDDIQQSMDRVLLRDIDGEMTAKAFLIKDGFNEGTESFYKTYSSLRQCLIGLEHFLKLRPRDWVVQYSERLSQLGKQTLTASIQTTSSFSNRYLNITFDVEGVTDRDINRILKAIAEDDNYISLSDGRIISVDQLTTDDQRHMLKTLQDDSEQWQNGDAVLTYQALSYADTLGQSEAFQAFYHDITHFKSEDYQPPSTLRAALADFQKYAVQWLNMLSRYGLGGILADEMGLGKTVQTIAFLLEYRDKNPDAKVLIVAPASVLYNWKHEIERFAPSLQSVIIDGTQEMRETLRQAHQEAIWIASYQSFRNDREIYHQSNFDVLVMDEAQALKNPRTLLYQAVEGQPATLRIGLCGTPLENNLQEFWALMQSVLPGLFPDTKTYSQLSIDDIRYMSSPFVLRRTKKDVALQLPDKTQYDRYLSLNNDQKTRYLAYLEDIKQRITQSEQSGQQAMSQLEILSAITRLRQICCHPKLVDEDYTGESSKFEHLKQWLSEALTNDRHILIFSQFTKMLTLIAGYLDEIGVPYFEITGETNKEIRQQQVDAFNRGERKIFLISLRAGGVGLNLTGADTVLLYDLWWNPSVEEQAIGRAHRIGQQNDVMVYRLITEGTIEERIAELQEEKRQLFHQLLDRSDIREMPSLSIDDLKFILGMKNSL